MAKFAFAAVLGLLHGPALGQKTCAIFVCPEGEVRISQKLTVRMPTAYNCCLDTCAIWTCKPGYVENKTKLTSTIVDDETCCAPTCQYYSCPSGYALNPATKSDAQAKIAMDDSRIATDYFTFVLDESWSMSGYRWGALVDAYDRFILARRQKSRGDLVDDLALEDGELAGHLRNIKELPLEIGKEQDEQEILKEVVDEALYERIVDEKEMSNDTSRSPFLVTHIRDMLKTAKEHAENMRGQNVVLLIGDAGTGKSTTACYLSRIRLNDVGGRFTSSSADGPKTVSPWFAFKHNTMVVDSPGFEDSRGDDYDLVSGLSLDFAVRDARSISAMLFHVPDAVIANRRGQSFLESLRQLRSRFPEIVEPDQYQARSKDRGRWYMVITQSCMLKQTEIIYIKDGEFAPICKIMKVARPDPKDETKTKESYFTIVPNLGIKGEKSARWYDMRRNLGSADHEFTLEDRQKDKLCIVAPSWEVVSSDFPCRLYTTASILAIGAFLVYLSAVCEVKGKKTPVTSRNVDLVLSDADSSIDPENAVSQEALQKLLSLALNYAHNGHRCHRAGHIWVIGQFKECGCCKGRNPREHVRFVLPVVPEHVLRECSQDGMHIIDVDARLVTSAFKISADGHVTEFWRGSLVRQHCKSLPAPLKWNKVEDDINPTVGKLTKNKDAKQFYGHRLGTYGRYVWSAFTNICSSMLVGVLLNRILTKYNRSCNDRSCKRAGRWADLWAIRWLFI